MHQFSLPYTRTRAQDVGEVLDPALEPILQKAVFKLNGRSLIRLGDTDVDYDDHFKWVA